MINETKAFVGGKSKYDKPSLKFIGSGKGVTAHGWGLYYSHNFDIAKKYANYTENGVVQEVEIPDDEFLIEEDLSFNEQSDYVKQCLINLDNALLNKYHTSIFRTIDKSKIEISNDLIRESFNYSKVAIDGKVAEKARNDCLNQIVAYATISPYLRNGLKKKIENYADNYTGYMQAISNIVLYWIDQNENHLEDFCIEKYKKTGAVIYQNLVDFFGDNSKKASLFMLKAKIKGIKYNDLVDGLCYVIFNPNDVSVKKI